MSGAARHGLQEARSPGAPGAGAQGCLTCGDSVARMSVLQVDRSGELALCLDEQRRRQRVDTGIVGAVAPGDTLLVHAGTALAREPA